MPPTPRAPLHLSDHALSVLVTEARYPSSVLHPCMQGNAAHAARASLRAARLINTTGRRTSRGNSLACTIATASTHLQLTTSTRPHERRLWLAPRSAVIAGRLADDDWELSVVPRGELWDELVTWLRLGERPEPLRRPSWDLDLDRLARFIDALQRGDRATTARLAGPPPTHVPATDGMLFRSVLDGRARCWHLRAQHRDHPRTFDVTAIDGGVQGWWRACQRATAPVHQIRLDPVDTHELWRSVSEALHCPAGIEDESRRVSGPMA